MAAHVKPVSVCEVDVKCCSSVLIHAHSRAPTDQPFVVISGMKGSKSQTDCCVFVLPVKLLEGPYKDSVCGITMNEFHRVGRLEI